jgi:diketogulonate reductase-like aldo/keto reductase
MTSSPAASSSSTFITLPSGSKMPYVGLGLWKAEQGSVADVVESAIRIGYRHFDSAADYGNEQQAGEGFNRAFKQGLVKREDLFITS